MKKSIIFTLLFILFCTIVLGLTLRGLQGNPTAKELNTPTWKEAGPLELSPDRGRYALLYSLVEDHSVIFSTDIARFVTPDLGISPSGHFVSLFAPALSYILIPGYILGRYFNLAQVGTFAVVALFALINALLIRWIAIRLGAHPIAATVGAMVFLFATPAFTYAVTLYQHHVTVFLILSSIAALMKWNGLKPLPYVWFMCGLSIALDNPNVFFMFPIGVYALTRIFSFRVNKENGKIISRVNSIGIATLLVMIIPIGLFLWYNKVANENPFQLSGTLVSVKTIDSQGMPFNQDQPIEFKDGKVVPHDKTAVGLFNTRHLLDDFYIHFFSPDRGIIWYGPAILFGLIGFWFLYSSNRGVANLLLAILGANILLYSMWGDPWGGWAFGSRYLIPSYAILGIGVGLALTKWRRKYLFTALFMIVFAYSVWVNTLGAITSSSNPPQIEILGLEKQTGLVEKYTYERNLDLLNNNISKSYSFQAYLKNYLTVPQFHKIIVGMISGSFALLLGWFSIFDRKSKNEEQ